MSENKEQKRKIDTIDEQDSSPKPPYHVDLGKNEIVKNTNSKDGSSSLPVPCRNGRRHDDAKCALTCDKVMCPLFGCKTMVCKGKDHAEGFGNQCQDCKRIVCDHHGAWFRDCDVCSKLFKSRGAKKYVFKNPTGGFSFFHVCTFCGNRNTCHQTRSEADGDFDDKYEKDGDFDDESFYCEECFMRSEEFYEEEPCEFYYGEECFDGYFMSENKEKKRKIDSSDEEDSSPTPPYHVDLDKNELVKNTNSQDGSSSFLPVPYRDGSARHPFLTLNEAQEALLKTNLHSYGDDYVVFASCASTCDKVKCSIFGCSTKICKDHAEGFGFFDNFNRDLVFYLNKCQDCSCVVCDHHRKKLRDCDVCVLYWDCAAQEDEEDSSFYPNRKFEFLVCRDCGNTCHTPACADGEDDGEEDGEECGFYCCKECFKRHECFNLYTMA